MIAGKTICLAMMGLGLAANTFGGLILFDLSNNPDIYLLLDNKASGSITNGGVIATLTASEGMLNRTTSGFGINGIGTDDTDALNADQYIEIQFDYIFLFAILVKLIYILEFYFQFDFYDSSDIVDTEDIRIRDCRNRVIAILAILIARIYEQ